MSKIHEDYYLRKYYLENNKVPTQSMMARKMGEALSSFYFKDMSDRLKVLAGIEPRMAGGGSNWCVSPTDLLKRKNTLKQVSKGYISHLKYIDLYALGEKVSRKECRLIKLGKQKVVKRNTEQWREIIKKRCARHEEIVAKEILLNYKCNINTEFNTFNAIYTRSVKQIESILRHSATSAVEQFRERTWELLKEYYKTSLQKQATNLKNKYHSILNKKKDKFKHKFIYNLKLNRTKTMAIVNDVEFEKQQAVEKLKNYFVHQNLACQLYVSLMEKEESDRQRNKLVIAHDQNITKLKTEIEIIDQELCDVKKKEIKQRENKKLCEEKIYEIIRKFQLFVTYCLKLIPEHAEFFINMETLLFLQLSDSLENSESESILLEEEPNELKNEKVEPYIIFNNNLNTEDKSLNIPMFMINRRCLCGVCKNNKDSTILQDLIQKNAENIGIEDEFDYSCLKPVKCTSQHKIKELKLESSLMQIIMNEIKHLERITSPCCHCKKKECHCGFRPYSETLIKVNESTTYEIFNESITLSMANQYFSEVSPKNCRCQELAKKQLIDCLPPYMLKSYHAPNLKSILHNYEPCTPYEIRQLVNQSKTEKETKTKETSIQHTEFDVIYHDYCKELYISDKIVVSEDAFDINHVDSSSTILTKESRELKGLISSEFEHLRQIFPEKKSRENRHIHFSSEHILCHYSM